MRPGGEGASPQKLSILGLMTLSQGGTCSHLVNELKGGGAGQQGHRRSPDERSIRVVLDTGRATLLWDLGPHCPWEQEPAWGWSRLLGSMGGGTFTQVPDAGGGGGLGRGGVLF